MGTVLRRARWWLLILILMPLLTHAKVIVIEGRYIIDRPTVYSHAVLDFSHGSFYITNNATVTIEDSTIYGTLSPRNPWLYQVTNGKLILKNSCFRIHAENLPQNPTSPPTQHLIRLQRGEARVSDSLFFMDQPYTAGFFIADDKSAARFLIAGNTIENFHGGVFAIHSQHGIISSNTFNHVSSGNIYALNASDLTIARNTILFSGNNNVGDSMDIIDSDNIQISQNQVFSSTCYSIFLMRSSNVRIEKNLVAHGITYAIYATNALSSQNDNFSYLSALNTRFSRYPLLHQENAGLLITGNLLSQNRFGLAISHARSITIKNNIFIQRFNDNRSRQFWTNNDVLLQDTTNLVWEKNQYKEAFTQSMTDRNDQSRQFVLFPAHNGVIL